MGVKKNTLTINGRTYDSVTGQIIDHGEKLHHKQVHAQKHEPVKVSPRKSEPRKITVRQEGPRDSGQRAHAIHVKTERSKTLKRSGLKKPILAKQATSVQGVLQQPSHVIIQGRSGHSSEQEHHNLRSKQISRFATHSQVHHKTASIPVKVAPVHTKTRGYSIDDTPPTPALPIIENIRESVDIFEQALSNATSHHSKHTGKKRTGRLRATGTLIAAVLLLTGFFAYQNAPRLALSAAQSEIGFAAKLPSYQPAGFGRTGAVQYQKGLVLATYTANSDDRSYTLSQTTANFDNFGLASNLTARGKTFETATVNGQSIYISRTGATWVKHGVWYTVEANASLNTEQLTRIAASL